MSNEEKTNPKMPIDPSMSLMAGRFDLVLSPNMPYKHSLSSLDGFGPATVKRLQERGFSDKKELLYLFPRSYRKTFRWFNGDILRALQAEYVEFIAEVVKIRPPTTFSARAPFAVTVKSGDASFNLVWFGMETASFLRKLIEGATLRIEGKVDYARFTPQMAHPTIEHVRADAVSPEPYIELIPVYPGFDGIQPKRLEAGIEQAARELLPYAVDIIPQHFLDMHKLPSVAQAFRELHLLDETNSRNTTNATFYDFVPPLLRNPEDRDKEETPQEALFKERLRKARERLVYEEFFTLQTKLTRDYVDSRKSCKALKCTDHSAMNAFIEKLPFDLTNDQKEALKIIQSDMDQSIPMRRLLQGDVGAGKTIVAFAATLNAVRNGGQVAFMAPTDVLAKQHLRRALEFFADEPIRIELLTGTQSAAERRKVLEDLRENRVDLIIGTHALFQELVEFGDNAKDAPEPATDAPKKKSRRKKKEEPVTEPYTLDLFSEDAYKEQPPKAPPKPKNDKTYNGLALVIVDEQHKFGVEQRERLLAKGEDPHLLAMTATPIPRTLAHAFYGDLDLIAIREKPPGRKPIRTYLRDHSAKTKMYAYIRQQIELQKIQVYVVYPLIEESDKNPEKPSLLKGAEELANRYLRAMRIGILHGRMTGDEKNEVMEKFARHELDVLCSTTVIEVGVDVANASVMVIEGAENFGLSQLHQLRGRVGRGEADSMCVLLAGSTLSEDTLERLVTFTKTEDGFELAEQDLKMRGPGEFLGVRQTGIGEFRFGDVIKDEAILETARRDVRRAFFGDVAK